MSENVLPVGKLSGKLLGELLAAHPVVDPAVRVGPGVGVDAAVLQTGADQLIVKTDPITFATDRAPYYLVNVNANDLACLGGTPRWLLVTALFPEGKTTETSVRNLFEELSNICAAHGIALVGGHTEITHGLDRKILVGQMLGTVTPARLLQPGQGRPGDRLLLTRPIAIEGTALLATELRAYLRPHISEDVLDRAAALLDDPGISVTSDASVLLDTGAVRAMHDPTEGGFATGLHELASASNCGAITSMDLIPILSHTIEIANVLHLNPLGILASGSLLAAIDPAGLDVVEKACREHEIPFSWVGKLTAREHGMRIRRGSETVDLPAFDSDEVTRAIAAVRQP